MSDEEEVMYVIVNAGLVSQMSKGKISAQVAHSACKAVHMAIQQVADHPIYLYYKKWYSGSYPKIVLKASEFEMKELMTKYALANNFRIVHTIDEGRTEIPKGSFTTLAFTPMPRNEVPEELKRFKLL